MKNIQIIENAENCTYDIFQATDTEFKFIFPDDGQEIEFIEELTERSKKNRRKGELKLVLNGVWSRWIDKKDATGIQGTLFFGRPNLLEVFPSKKWDLSASELNDVLVSISKNQDSL